MKPISYHNKMKPINVKLDTYIESSKETNKKSPKFKEQNIKTFQPKVTIEFGLKKLL